MVLFHVPCSMFHEVMESYRLILYIVFGILPSLIWLFYYLKKDLHPEPKKMILKIFLLGSLVTIPAFLVQIELSQALQALQSFSFFANYSVIIDLIKWFLVIALTEELLKYLVVRQAVLGSFALDEPLDIMLYMVVVALGFSAVENILYIFSPVDNSSFSLILQTTATISLIRFLGATFLHTLCSAFVGYFLALASLRRKNRIQLTAIGLGLAALFHGLYDFSIVTFQPPLNFIIPVLVILGLATFMSYDFNEIKKIKSICKI